MKSIVRFISQMAEDVRAIRVAVERTANANRQAVKAGARERR